MPEIVIVDEVRADPFPTAHICLSYAVVLTCIGDHAIAHFRAVYKARMQELQ